MPIQMRDTMEDYQRDVKRARLDESPSEEDILRLLCQRESLRQARRFSESDAIREELRAMGIELFDNKENGGHMMAEEAHYSQLVQLSVP